MIYLVRHGETVFNTQGRYQGRFDSPVTNKGHDEIHQIMACILRDKVKHFRVFSSSSYRAVWSAQQMIDKLKCWAGWKIRPASTVRKIIWISDELREQDYGDWEGLTAQEIEGRFPGQLQDRINTGTSYRPPNGESYDDVKERAKSFCNQLDVNRNYLIVTHKKTSQAIREILFPEIIAAEHTQDSYFVLDLNDHKLTQHRI